jgi:hypothetical protein
MGKKFGSGMNNPDHISERLEKIFGVKVLKFFDAEPGWKKFKSGMGKIRIRDPGSATLVSRVHLGVDSTNLTLIQIPPVQAPYLQ